MAVAVLTLGWINRPLDPSDSQCPLQPLSGVAFLRNQEASALWAIIPASAFDHVTVRQITVQASAIVLGQVEDVGRGTWNRPDGRPDEPPAGVTPEWITGAQYIATDLILRVERAWKGAVSGQLRFRLEEGEAANWTMVNGFEPKINLGQRVVLWLRNDDRPYEGQLAVPHFGGFGRRGAFLINGEKVVGCEGRFEPLEALSARLDGLTR